MQSIRSTRQRFSAWKYFAAWLSFLAVLSALLAPVSTLAQDVRTGRLGGVCSAVTLTSQPGGPSGDAPNVKPHCDLCGTPGLVLPPLPVVSMPCTLVQGIAAVDLPPAFGAAVPGLPFSRGPPALLN